MEGARPTPKPRPIKLEAHILAYLGDFMSVFEESVKRIAINSLRHAGQSQAGQSNTASARNPS
jgi:hypothetical protein